MKTTSTKIIFWVPTIMIVLFEGLLPALTFQTKLATEGIRHLGYPSYFGPMLMVFKVLGALTLVLPRAPKLLKEWAYAGFAFDFIAACVSHWVIDGFGADVIFTFVAMAILALSYIYYHKLTSD